MDDYENIAEISADLLKLLKNSPEDFYFIREYIRRAVDSKLNSANLETRLENNKHEKKS